MGKALIAQALADALEGGLTQPAVAAAPPERPDPSA
jgi:hypothetical protein